MLSPSSKGWIKKYFDLVEKGNVRLEINRPKSIRKLNFMHLTLVNSGIVFGHPHELIFAKELDTVSWTTQEKLKVLLFEAHLFIYLQVNRDEEFDREAFVDALIEFYKFHNARSITNLFSLFRKASKEEMLESILTSRVDIKLKLLENKWWVNSLSNAFVFLDVILFDDFEHKDQYEALMNYNEYAMNALLAMTCAAYSDGQLEDKEKDMFNVFLASAGLPDELRMVAKQRLKSGADLDDFSDSIKDHWLLKHFLLDISALLIFSNHKALQSEMEFLSSMADKLGIPLNELDESLALVENFVWNSKDNAPFLSDHAAYEKVYISLTSRWSRVIVRNKEKLAIEIKESKELVLLISKSTTQELSAAEKEAIKAQLKDIAKSVPALAIFMLPGGSLLMPILLKALPELVPSAFRENQIEDDEDKEK